jgi:transposase
MRRDCAKVIDARRAFCVKLARIPPHRLVVLDESGSHIAMTRDHGRAPPGVRVIGRVPRNRGTVTTMLGALAMRGLTALMRVRGGTSRDVFLEFLRERLLPTLRRGDVVVMDDLGAHYATGVRELVERAGAEIVYMPAYSPDLNPIELCWSKLKNLLKMSGARTNATLASRIQVAADFITRTDCRNWFKHFGYAAPQAM